MPLNLINTVLELRFKPGKAGPRIYVLNHCMFSVVDIFKEFIDWKKW